jgi:4-hydroxy-3-methylbut-2-en-1-yl diphosphate reductase
MKTIIEQASEIGFCFGVRRAIDILETKIKIYDKIESLGDVVHNEQVMRQLAEKGINVIRSIEDIKGGVVAISAHGVSPDIEAKLKAKNIELIDTTCPFVRRAQLAARKFSEAGYFTVVYGEAQHTEVKGILGWARNQGMAALDIKDIRDLHNIPRRIGVLSQTTQIPEKYNSFAKDLIDVVLKKDAEVRILDTICHDIRVRQSISFDLAQKVDLMLVVGGHSSANTKRLLELCSGAAETYLIDSVDSLDLSWLKGKNKIGITSGTSTSLQTIEEIVRGIQKIIQEDSEYNSN